MKLILFDLDGTLLTTGGIGQRSSKKALETVFGTAKNLEKIYLGGRTQEAIFADTLKDAGIDQLDYQAKRDQLYDYLLKTFIDGIKNGTHSIKPLPGALEVVDVLRSNENISLGIVTGNHMDIAVLKLTQAGFNPGWFPVGAFGHESASRPDLVSMAQKRAEAKTGLNFPGKSTIVVGDTTRDVLSAKSVNAMSIALTSGTDTRQMLKAVKPDFIFDEIKEVLAILE